MKKIYLLLSIMILSLTFGNSVYGSENNAVQNKSHVIKNKIISKTKIKKVSNGKKYIEKIDFLVTKMSDKKLLKVSGKLEKLNLSSRKESFNNNVFKYLESVILLEIYSRGLLNISIITEGKDIEIESNKYDISMSFIDGIDTLYEESYSDIELLKKIKALKKTNLSNDEQILLSFYIVGIEGSIYLNHQNFLETEKLYKKYINDNKDHFDLFSQYSNYIQFTSFVQSKGFLDIGSVDILMELREKYYPNESMSAFNITRNKGYKNIDCDKLLIIDVNIDYVPFKFCKLLNNNFEESDIEDLDKLSDNIQNYSDIGNYLSYSQGVISNKNKSLKLQKEIAEKIILEDKSYVNGYLLLMNYYTKNSNCINFQKYYDLLEKNYIGDDLNLIKIKKNRLHNACVQKGMYDKLNYEILAGYQVNTTGFNESYSNINLSILNYSGKDLIDSNVFLNGIEISQGLINNSNGIYELKDTTNIQSTAIKGINTLYLVNNDLQKKSELMYIYVGETFLSYDSEVYIFLPVIDNISLSKEGIIFDSGNNITNKKINILHDLDGNILDDGEYSIKISAGYLDTLHKKGGYVYKKSYIIDNGLILGSGLGGIEYIPYNEKLY